MESHNCDAEMEQRKENEKGRDEMLGEGGPQENTENGNDTEYGRSKTRKDKERKHTYAVTSLNERRKCKEMTKLTKRFSVRKRNTQGE